MWFEAEVGVLHDADPVQLQTLYLELRGGILQIIGGTNVVAIVEKPVHGVHWRLDVERVRFQKRRGATQIGHSRGVPEVPDSKMVGRQGLEPWTR